MVPPGSSPGNGSAYRGLAPAMLENETMTTQTIHGELTSDAYGSVYEYHAVAFPIDSVGEWHFVGKLNGRTLAEFVKDQNAIDYEDGLVDEDDSETWN